MPAITIAIAQLLDLMGKNTDISDICTIKDSSVAVWFFSLLGIALAYNAFVYIRVHRLMHAALSANAVVLDPEASQAMCAEAPPLRARATTHCSR